jgi:hypothetical protein
MRKIEEDIASLFAVGKGASARLTRTADIVEQAVRPPRREKSTTLKISGLPFQEALGEGMVLR